VVEYGGTNNPYCTARGFSASMGSKEIPLWEYTLDQCFADLIDDIYNPIALSDDGSMAFVGVRSTYSSSGNHSDYYTPQLHALDGQTGKLLWVYELPQDQMAQHVSTSRHGDYTAWTEGDYIYVFLKNGSLRTDPIFKGYETPSHICPMGVYLTYGFTTALISLWDDASGTYQKVAEFDGNNTWALFQSATSVNGGGTQPDGGLVAFGWADFTVHQVRIEVYNLNTLKKYWQWTSALNVNDQTLPYLSWHMNYLGVATWGDHGAVTPTVFLFNLQSGTPLFNYTTPGSMFDLGVLVNNAPIPDGMTEDEYLGKGLTETEKLENKRIFDSQFGADPDDIYLVAAGKDTPASEMGRGGDAVAFHLSFPHL